MSVEPLSLEQLRARRNNKWRFYPEDVLPAWVADMDYTAPAPLKNFMRQMAEASDFCYPLKPPYPQLNRALAQRMDAHFGWNIDGLPVEALNDVVQGIGIALMTLGEAGQGAVVHPPIYGPFLEATRDTQRPAVFNPIVPTENGYALDFDQLERAVTESTRFLLLCNPHNPTGRVFTRNELGRLAEVALRHDLVILSDEIHADLVYPGHAHVPMATLSEEVAARTVTFYSASKAFNIAGLRFGVAIFGSDALHRRFKRYPRCLRGGFNAFGAEATRIALEECDGWLDDVLAYLDGNRDLIAQAVRGQMPGVVYREPEATYFAWLDCRRLDLGEEPFDFFLREARVALEPGVRFGPQGAGFARLNFATSKSLLAEMLERMAAALDRA